MDVLRKSKSPAGIVPVVVEGALNEKVELNILEKFVPLAVSMLENRLAGIVSQFIAKGCVPTLSLRKQLANILEKFVPELVSRKSKMPSASCLVSPDPLNVPSKMLLKSVIWEPSPTNEKSFVARFFGERYVYLP